jgi:hypothetical protein
MLAWGFSEPLRGTVSSRILSFADVAIASLPPSLCFRAHCMFD